MTARLISVALLLLLGVLQAQLWWGRGSLPRVYQMQAQLQSQLQSNAQTRLHNEQLAAEVRDLQDGLEMTEEKARLELGMVKPDEIYVQVAK